MADVSTPENGSYESHVLLTLTATATATAALDGKQYWLRMADFHYLKQLIQCPDLEGRARFVSYFPPDFNAHMYSI